MLVVVFLELQYLIVVARHGARYPMWKPEDETFAGFGEVCSDAFTVSNGTSLPALHLQADELEMQLRAYGCRKMYERGYRFRSKYVEFLHTVDPNSVVYHVSVCPRTYLSGGAFLQGAFDLPRLFDFTLSDIEHYHYCAKYMSRPGIARSMNSEEDRCLGELQRYFNTNASLFQIAEYIVLRRALNYETDNEQIRVFYAELPADGTQAGQCAFVAEEYFHNSWETRFCEGDKQRGQFEQRLLAGHFIYEALRLIRAQDRKFVYYASHDSVLAPAAALLLGPQFDCKQPEFGGELIVEVHYDSDEAFRATGDATIRLRYYNQYVDFAQELCKPGDLCHFKELSRQLERFAVSGEFLASYCDG